jgi:hypothetical protein
MFGDPTILPWEADVVPVSAVEMSYIEPMGCILYCAIRR